MRDHECRLAEGAKCTYVAMFLWFVAASFSVMNEERRASEGGEQSDVGNSIDNDGAREPLIQDVIFECEQSTISCQDGEEAGGEQ